MSIHSGQAVWNGRKADGAAVRDGHYELVADGLRSWVEVDLNAVTITDDIRQPLITGMVPKTSAHWAARFTSFAASPVDGVVYLTEKLSNAYGDLKMWRWNGERLEDVIDWPAGHWTIRQMSAQEDVFITWGFTGFEYSLLRFPGPVVDPLPAPDFGATPHLSPDGEWILWVNSSSVVERRVFLQRVDELGETFEFGPYSPGPVGSWNFQATVHWSPNGDRAIVTMHATNIPVFGEVGLVLDIDAGHPPSVRELHLDQACGGNDFANGPAPVSVSIGFDDNLLLCTRDMHRDLHIIDLDDRIDDSIGRSSGCPQHRQRSCTA